MIDWTRVAELRDEIGADDFAEIVALFLEEVEARLSELAEPPASPPALAELCHFLKGSAANLGFVAFFELCDHGERAAKDGQTEGVDRDAIILSFYDSKDIFEMEFEKRLAA